MSIEEWRDDQDFRSILGTPDQVVEQLRRYADTGVEELIVQWLDPDGMAGVEIIAREVLPRLTEQS